MEGDAIIALPLYFSLYLTKTANPPPNHPPSTPRQILSAFEEIKTPKEFLGTAFQFSERAFGCIGSKWLIFQ